VKSGEVLGSLGLVVGGVVGEDGGAVEGTVFFGEVEPALVTNGGGSLASNADSDDVG